MKVHVQETVDLVSAGLRLGVKAYESALRLESAGHHVPGLDEFVRRMTQVHRLADDSGNSSGGSGTPASLEKHSVCFATVASDGSTPVQLKQRR